MTSNQSRRGFSLIELMITLTLFSIVMTGVFESFTRQHKTSIVTEDVVEVQQSVRAIAALVEREIRMAGFLVPNGAGICGLDVTDGPDELFVSEIEPIVPDDVQAGDLGAEVISNWSNPSPGGSAFPLTLDDSAEDLDGDGASFYDNDGNNTPESDFREGGGFILTDVNNPQRGSVCGIVESVTSATVIRIEVVSGRLGLRDAVNGAEERIIIVPAAHYAMNTEAAFVGRGRFDRNGDLLAESIDDFQVSYIFDVDEDGVIDDAVATVDEQPGQTGRGTYNPGLYNNGTLKQVNVSLVVRTRATDPDFEVGDFINLENRAQVVNADAGNPGDGTFRRRVITASIRPRNIGIPGSI